MQRITDSVVDVAKKTQQATEQVATIETDSQQAALSNDQGCGVMKSKKQLFNISTSIVSAVALLTLPVESYTTTPTNNDISEYFSKPADTKDVLTLASVKGDSTYFAIDGFEHGFGYDLARNYASYLGVELNLQTYDNTEEALQAVKKGEADMALTTASTKLKSELSLSSINLSCGRDAKLTENGLHPKVSWSFANSDNRLAHSASYYLCDSKQLEHTAKLARFYNQNLLKDAYNKMHFEKAMDERLPNYQSSFKQVADKYDHDWELLVAMGYQESHLKANAVSRTGVQGLMMLTRDTAREMGIRNRIDPKQSIRGGARYLERLKETFADVPKSDRIFFALASYNMGPYAVKRIQNELREQEKNDKSWANVYAYMVDNASENSRYVQCMHYVSNIRSYLETIKMQSQDA